MNRHLFMLDRAIIIELDHFIFLMALRMWNEQVRLSSILIKAPLFSNYPQ